MYTLKQNSLTSRFYAWIWNTDVTKFKNMCPYFWKYVFTVLFLPLILVAKFTNYIVSFIPTSKRTEKVASAIITSAPMQYTGKAFSWVISRNIWSYVGTAIKWLYFIAIGALLLAGLVFAIYSAITDTINFFAGVGMAATLLAIIIGLGVFYSKYNAGEYIKRFFKRIWTFFEVMWTMMYSLYKNMCPLVTWK